MAKFFGKKQVVLGTLVLALGVAVYLNYYMAQQSSDAPPADVPTTQSTAPDNSLGDALNVNANPNELSNEAYFNEARENREASREEAAELIKDLLNDVKATSEQKAEMTAQAAAMAQAIQQESKIEELIKAKGFDDCVVYIEGDRCSVVVKSEELTALDATKISQVITAQSNILAQNINITAIK